MFFKNYWIGADLKYEYNNLNLYIKYINVKKYRIKIMLFNKFKIKYIFSGYNNI